MSREEKQEKGQRVLVAGDDLNFKPFVINDPVPLGRQILETAGFDADGDASLFAILDGGDFEDIRLDEKVNLRKRGIERFVAFRSDRLFRLEVEKDQVQWGKPAISGQVLHRLARATEDEAIFLEVRGGTDRLIEASELVDLNQRGVERFFKAPKPDPSVQIIVNAREKTVPNKNVAFEQIVALAFPGCTDNLSDFTVTYDGALSCPPDGILGIGKTIQVKNGTIFNVKRTIQS